MRKFSKIAAGALALALSVTLVAPISANAQIITSWERDENGDIKSTTYTNEDTKESISTKDGFSGHYYDDDLSVAVSKEETTKIIAIKSMAETISLSTTKDVAKFSNFKSNKSKFNRSN